LGVLDDTHLLGNEETLGDREWVDTDCTYDSVNHVYIK
jgi:hypothetical protein